jgi:hypothetical protein
LRRRRDTEKVRDREGETQGEEAEEGQAVGGEWWQAKGKGAENTTRHDTHARTHTHTHARTHLLALAVSE